MRLETTTSNLTLIGFQASGKTTLGRLLAQYLNQPFVDIDDLIMQSHPSLTCREINRIFGEDYFRSLESEVVAGLSEVKNTIIATGGGVILKETNMQRLKTHSICLYLRTSSFILKQRIWERPVLPSYLDPNHPEASFDLVYHKRLRLYEQWADGMIDMDQLSITHALQQVVNHQLVRNLYGC